MKGSEFPHLLCLLGTGALALFFIPLLLQVWQVDQKHHLGQLRMSAALQSLISPGGVTYSMVTTVNDTES